MFCGVNFAIYSAIKNSAKFVRGKSLGYGECNYCHMNCFKYKKVKTSREKY